MMYLAVMNGYQIEKFKKFIKDYNLRIPLKYLEKGLLSETTDGFNIFYFKISQALNNSEMSIKTFERYRNMMVNHKYQIWCLWRELNNII